MATNKEFKQQFETSSADLARVNVLVGKEETLFKVRVYLLDKSSSKNIVYPYLDDK